jgi:copper transport protein
MAGDRRGPTLAAWALAAAAVALALAPTAAAHAELLYSSPPQGTRLDEAPGRVTVTFTEDIEPEGTAIAVRNATGVRVDLGDLAIEELRVASVGLPPLPPGPYLVAWRTISASDGHPEDGTFGFAVGDFEPPAAEGARLVPIQSALSRAVSYAGFSLAFGAVAFLLWMRPVGYPGGLARSVLLAGVTLHLSGAVLLAAGTAAGAGVGFEGLANPQFEAGLWRLLAVAAGAMAWVLALVWTVRPVAAGPAVITALLLASAVASANLGHPYGRGLMAIDFLHLVSAATWAGGLVLLLLFVRRAGQQGTPEATVRAVGIRFGTLALACVVLLAVTGVVLTVGVVGPEVLGDAARLFSAPYTFFLLGKVLLAIAMVAVAAVNRYVLLEEPADAGLAGSLQKAARKATGGRLAPGLATGRFGRLVAVEATMAAVVLALAGFLTAVPPPGTAEAVEPDLRLYEEGAYHNVTLGMAPPRVGASSTVHLRITPLDPTEPPVANNTCGRSEGSCVTVTVAYGNAPGGEEHDAQPAGGGTWMMHQGIWAQAGPAHVTVRISTAQHFEDVVVFRVDVRA